MKKLIWLHKKILFKIAKTFNLVSTKKFVEMQFELRMGKK